MSYVVKDMEGTAPYEMLFIMPTMPQAVAVSRTVQGKTGIFSNCVPDRSYKDKLESLAICMFFWADTEHKEHDPFTVAYGYAARVLGLSEVEVVNMAVDVCSRYEEHPFSDRDFDVITDCYGFTFTFNEEV